MDIVNVLIENFQVFADSFSVSPVYIKVGFFVFLIFLLIVSMAQFRHHFVKWSFKGGLIGLFFGFLFTILIEGFLIIGGNTLLTSVFGWKSAPKPFKTAIDLGRNKLTEVLGESTESPQPVDIMNILQNMSPAEIKKVKAIMCTP